MDSRITVQGQPHRKTDLIQKQLKQIRSRRIPLQAVYFLCVKAVGVQVAEYLSSKWETLNLNSSTTKTKRNLIQCKCYINSCYTVLFRQWCQGKESVHDQYKHNLFSPNIFVLWLVEFLNVSSGVWRANCNHRSHVLRPSWWFCYVVGESGMVLWAAFRFVLGERNTCVYLF
jgi:hypothetical protein